MSPTELHPRSATEIIDAAFRLLGQHYAQFVAISVVAMLPLIILRLFMPAVPSFTSTSYVAMYLAAVILSFICNNVAEGATVIAVSDSYLSGKVDIAGALAATMSRILSVLALSLLRGFLVGISFMVGIIALFIPGFYVLFRTFASMPALLLERLSASEAIGRSWRLAGGSMWKVTGTLLLAFVIWLLGLIFMFTIVGILGSLLGLRGNPVLGVFETVLGAFLYPIIAVVVTLLYYDLRIRREGFDLEIMAKELG